MDSRRTFLERVTLVGTALTLGASELVASAAPARTIRVGFISPRSGPEGGFGEGDPYILDLARKTLAKGLKSGGATYAVEIIDRDSQSDPARAGQLAKELITTGAIDFMLTTSTPETVNPVSDACEAGGMPCLATIIPWEGWYFGRGAKPGQPSPFKWTYLFSFGSQQFVDLYTSVWKKIPTNKRVAALYPNDADGNAVRQHLIPGLEKAGYTVIDAGPYEDGTTDFSSQIARFKAERCEIFNSFPIPPDFTTFWRQATQQGYTEIVKIAQPAKFGLFPSMIEAVGSLGNRLANDAYWHPDFPYRSSLTGLSGRQLVDGYEKATGKQWNQQLGASMSLLDAGAAVLQQSANPKDKAALARTMSRLKTTTMVGKVDFTSGPVANVSTTIVVGTQWLKSKPGSGHPFELVIVENEQDTNIPVNAKLLPYNSAT